MFIGVKNALLNSKSKGTIEEREAAAAQTSEQLLPLFQNSGYDVILTHGNGPQVGLLAAHGEHHDRHRLGRRFPLQDQR